MGEWGSPPAATPFLCSQAMAQCDAAQFHPNRRTARSYYAKAIELTAGGSLRALFGVLACSAHITDKVRGMHVSPAGKTSRNVFSWRWRKIAGPASGHTQQGSNRAARGYDASSSADLQAACAR